MSSLYETLKVGKDASPEEIKKAHRRLAQKHHPDHGGNGEDYRTINEAYKVLSDPIRRRQYDRCGTVEPDFDPTVAAMQVLAGWFSQIIDGCDDKPANINLILIMKEQVKRELAEAKNKRSSAARTIKRSIQFSKRLSVTKGTPPFLFKVLDEKKFGALAILRHVEKHKKVMAEVSRLLDLHEYNFKKKQSWPATSSYTMTFGGGEF